MELPDEPRGLAATRSARACTQQSGAGGVDIRRFLHAVRAMDPVGGVRDS